MDVKVDIFGNFALKSVLAEFGENFDILWRRKSTINIHQTYRQYRPRENLAIESILFFSTFLFPVPVARDEIGQTYTQLTLKID